MEYTISPPRGFLTINWPELWRFRDLLLTMAWRNVSVRYKQAALGIAWAILQPVATMVIFTFIFNRMAKIQSGDNVPYPIFFYTGMLFWQYFSSTLSTASNSMVSNAALIKKVYFPRLIIPISTAITGLVDLAVASTVFFGLMLWYGFAPHLAGLVIIPILLFITVVTSIGVGMFLAAINIKYRDVGHALPFCIQILMYVTPVIYPVKMLDQYPVAKNLMLWLNPISAVITNARAGFLGQSPIDWAALGIALFSGMVMFIIGLYYFRNTERYFADIA